MIDNVAVRNEVTLLIEKVKKAKKRASSNIHANVVDPFSAAVEMSLSGWDGQEWLESEKSRQVQKSLQNAIGEFHQAVLGTFPGWESTGKSGGSIDLISQERKIVAEIKNKHNTMNSSSAEALHQKFVSQLRYNFVGYTAYVVKVLPKDSLGFDRPWTHNLKIAPLRDDIREIDGQSFYEFVSGRPDTLSRVFNLLLAYLEKDTNDIESNLSSDTTLIDLFGRAYNK